MIDDIEETEDIENEIEDEIGTVEDIIESVRCEDISDKIADIVSDDETEPADTVIALSAVNNLDDALRAVDNSGLSPAPVTNRSLIIKSESMLAADSASSEPTKTVTGKKSTGSKKSAAGKGLFGKGTDKYGLPLEDKTDPDTFSPISVVPPVEKKTAPLIPIPRFPGISELLGIKDDSVYPGNEDEDTGPSDFKVNFDFESAYKDPPEYRPLRWRRERRTGLVGGLLYAIFIMCIAVVLASAMWIATVDVLGFSAPDETVDVLVPADFSMDGIADTLYEAGLIRYKALFNLFADFSNAEEKIVPGAYVLNKNYDYRALVQGMTARAGVRVETTVTIPEGYSLAQIFALLESEDVCSADELWKAAAQHDFNYYFLSKDTVGDRLRLEGFLFPDTYNFYKESTAVRAITRMLSEFNNKFNEQYVDRADQMGYTIKEIITIASMVEREAGDDDERPRIAAVIYNRLNNPDRYPYLEIDATIFYAIAGRGVPFSTGFDSPYNTYMYPGLPPGPISNPGMSSILAALYPLETNEYFYALNKEGTHNFFTNAADHQAFVNSDDYGG